MTRQRLREGSIKWETQLSLNSLKNIKKNTTFSFSDKTKVIKSFYSRKSKAFIENKFVEELNYFQKILF